MQLSSKKVMSTKQRIIRLRQMIAINEAQLRKVKDLLNSIKIAKGL